MAGRRLLVGRVLGEDEALVLALMALTARCSRRARCLQGRCRARFRGCRCIPRAWCSSRRGLPRCVPASATASSVKISAHWQFRTGPPLPGEVPWRRKRIWRRAEQYSVSALIQSCIYEPAVAVLAPCSSRRESTAAIKLPGSFFQRLSRSALNPYTAQGARLANCESRASTFF